MTASATELAFQRLNTERFINTDPSTIVLKTREDVWLAGTKKRVTGSDRSAQTFKVIWPGDTGFAYTIEGTTRRFDFILVGQFDAVVEIGDYWTVGNQDNEIEYIFPSNGYELKCGGSSHGSHPGV